MLGDGEFANVPGVRILPMRTDAPHPMPILLLEKGIKRVEQLVTGPDPAPVQIELKPWARDTDVMILLRRGRGGARGPLCPGLGIMEEGEKLDPLDRLDHVSDVVEEELLAMQGGFVRERGIEPRRERFGGDRGADHQPDGTEDTVPFVTISQCGSTSKGLLRVRELLRTLVCIVAVQAVRKRIESQREVPGSDRQRAADLPQGGEGAREPLQSAVSLALEGNIDRIAQDIEV